MNCAIAAENSEHTSKLKWFLEKQAAHFQIIQIIELNHDYSVNDFVSCDVLFFSPQREIIRLVEHLIPQTPGVIPTLFVESNHPDIPLIDSAALEMIILPSDLGQLLKLENKIMDLKSLHERSEAFAVGWSIALNFFLKQLDARNPEWFVLPDIDGYREVNASELLKLEGNGPYTTAHLTNGNRATLCKSLGHFEQVLNSSQFFRLSNDHLVNGNSIVDWKLNQPAEAVLIDGTTIPISPRRVPLLIEMIQQRGASGMLNNQKDD